MSECRPPDGTPDGTVCWLHHVGKRRPQPRTLWRWRKIGKRDRWYAMDGCRYLPPEMAHTRNWRFHSIAHPPGEHQPRETRDE